MSIHLTKHFQACVAIENGGVKIVVDPGVFDADLSSIIADADALLVTHIHGDHFDRDTIATTLAAEPELMVYGPPAVHDALGDVSDQVIAVEPGDSFTVGPVSVTVSGGSHAPVYDGETVAENRAYLIADTIYHPGDSFSVPDGPVDTLLVPVSGPWMKIGEAMRFVQAVRPRRSIAIHDMVNSTMGNDLAREHLDEASPTGVELLQPQPGDSIDLPDSRS